MAISNEVRRAGPYRGDGTATQFPFGFVVFDEADVAVYLFEVESATETKLGGDQFTVTLNDNQDNAPGGLVTIISPLPVGVNLSVISEMEYTQPMVLTNRGGFYPSILNKSADRSTIMSQQLKEKLDRALMVPVASEETPAEMTQRLLRAQEDAKKYATEAGESAKRAEEARQDVFEAREEIKETKEHIDQQKEAIDQSKAFIDQSEKHVGEMLNRAEEIDKGVQELLPIKDEMVTVGENMEAVKIVADDLIGELIDSIDLGYIKDPVDKISVPTMGNTKTVAQNMEKLKDIHDALPELLKAREYRDQAQQAANTSEQSAKQAVDAADRLHEIEKTDFAQIYKEGV